MIFLQKYGGQLFRRTFYLFVTAKSTTFMIKVDY